MSIDVGFEGCDSYTCLLFLGFVLLSCLRVHVVCYIGSCLFHGVVIFLSQMM